jgi:N-acyl-D-aspartate/D-glutamate deacylase
VKEAAVLDLLIRDASIVDGTGAAARHGDVGDGGDAGYGLRSGRDKKTGTNVSVVR